LPRPPVKKTRVCAKAAEEGRLKAQTEHEYKSVKFLADLIPFLPEKYKKNAVLWMKSIFEKHLAKIPKGIAIIGMTLIVKQIIHSSDEFIGKVAAISGKKPSWLAYTPAGMHMTIAEALVSKKGEKVEDFIPEWTEWLIAFSLAYIIVEHGGQIALGIGEGLKGLTGMVGFLLG